VTDPSLHAIDARRRAARDRASGPLAAMTAVLAVALPAFGLVAQAQAPARPATTATRTQAPAAAPVLKDTVPYKSMVYNVAFAYPKKDWVAVPAAGGNIALLMHKKGEASLALDFQVLRVALAPDEIDDTFKEIELEALAQRAPHARVTSSALDALGGNKVVIVKYGASGLSGDLDVTQYSIVSGASLYRLTCAATRATAARHASACETVARTLVVGK
jgi:hypothetical protein